MKPGDMQDNESRVSRSDSSRNSAPAWKKKEFHKPVETEEEGDKSSSHRDDRGRRDERNDRRRRRSPSSSSSSSSSSGNYLVTSEVTYL